MYEKVELEKYLESVRKELKEYNSAAEEEGLSDWQFLCDELVRLVQEIAADPNATTWALEEGDIFLPQGLTAEESASCCAENFYLCVRDEFPRRGEDVILEFASGVVQ